MFDIDDYHQNKIVKQDKANPKTNGIGRVIPQPDRRYYGYNLHQPGSSSIWHVGRLDSDDPK